MKYTDVQKRLRQLALKERKKTNEWFFKTGKGEYGYGDKFIGVSMPDARKVAKQFLELPFPEIKKLFSSPIHEERMVGHLILVYLFEKGSEPERKEIYNFYLKHTKHINNWDLVDTSAHKIVGAHLFKQKKNARNILYELARSKNMWERRISIIATAWFINQNDFIDTIKISKMLLTDEEDLLHKAVGWMLREVGKRDVKMLEKFLKQHYKTMPRTMLRYAIEKFPETKRKKYLLGKI